MIIINLLKLIIILIGATLATHETHVFHVCTHALAHIHMELRNYRCTVAIDNFQFKINNLKRNNNSCMTVASVAFINKKLVFCPKEVRRIAKRYTDAIELIMSFAYFPFCSSVKIDDNGTEVHLEPIPSNRIQP